MEYLKTDVLELTKKQLKLIRKQRQTPLNGSTIPVLSQTATKPLSDYQQTAIDEIKK